MRGLLPLLPALLLLTQPWSVAGVLPTGMIEFKNTEGYTYCAGGVRGGAGVCEGKRGVGVMTSMMRAEGTARVLLLPSSVLAACVCKSVHVSVCMARGAVGRRMAVAWFEWFDSGS